MILYYYKFYLAFEKVSRRHYITEEFWFVALQHDVIPVVMGPPREDYEVVTPPHSFIHVSDFQSVGEMCHDIALYKSYLTGKIKVLYH